MNRVVWAALALLVSVPSFGTAQQASGTAAAKPAARAAKAGDKAAAKPPAAKDTSGAKAAKATPGAKAAKAAKPPANAAALALARRSRSVFLYAVDSCEQSKKSCDTALLDDAEQRFMDACGACAPFQRCEESRQAIRAGRSREVADPCAQ